MRAEIGAWSRNDIDEVMSDLADDATFDFGPDWPKLAGRAAIRDMMRDGTIMSWREYFHPPRDM